MEIDTILDDAVVVTVDPDRPRARRIGLHQGRILGLDEQLDGVRARRSLRLGGACVVPGFHDAHNHTALFGLSLGELDLSERSCRTLEDVYRAVAAQAGRTPTGE